MIKDGNAMQAEGAPVFVVSLSFDYVDLSVCLVLCHRGSAGVNQPIQNCVLVTVSCTYSWLVSPTAATPTSQATNSSHQQAVNSLNQRSYIITAL